MEPKDPNLPNDTQPEQSVEPDSVSSSPEAFVPTPAAPENPPAPSTTPESAQAMVTPSTSDSAPSTAYGTPESTSGANTPYTQPAPEPAATPMPTVSTGGPVAVSAGGPNAGDKRRRGKRWLLPLIILLVLVLAAGYVFGMYLPNRPAAVYSSGLKNTGKAVDKLVDYATSQAKAKYNSYAFDGATNVKSNGGSFDLTLNGAFDMQANGTLTAKADVMGQNITANVRSIHAKGNNTPDIYLQVGGIKQYLDSAGLSSLSKLDGKWIAVDHTLLDTYASELQHTSSTKQTTTPTPEEYNDALVRVQTVNKQYLFTTDKSTAVLQDQHYVGKETKDGRSTYHYTVGYSQAHLQAYVNALKPALDGSKLNVWSKQANGKDLSQELNLDELSRSVKNAKSDYRFDLWVDAKTKLIHSLQFADPSDKSSVFTITQNYTGGNRYPFTIAYGGKDDSGTPQKGQFSLDVNADTNVYTGSFSVTSGKNGSDTAHGSFTLKPSNNPVHVTAPKGSEPIAEVLNQIGLGFLAPSAATQSSSPVNDNLFTLSQ